MNTPEGHSGGEYARPDELKATFETMRDWLVEHGVYFEGAPQKVCDPESGLLIYYAHHSNDPENFEYRLSLDEVQKCAPQAAEKLRIGGELRLWYIPAHFEYDTTSRQTQYVAETCSVLFDLDESSPYEDQSLAITKGTDLGSSDFVSFKHATGVRDEHAETSAGYLQDLSLEEIMLNPLYADRIKNMLLEFELGTNEMTKDDCDNLHAIIKSLKELK